MRIQENNKITPTTCFKMTEEFDRSYGVNGYDNGPSDSASVFSFQGANNVPSSAEAQTTSSAATGGRLKFFKDGKLLLELAQSCNGERSNWVSVPRKIFWPPASAAVNASSFPCNQDRATSLSGSEESSISSPWLQDQNTSCKKSYPKKNLSKDLEFIYIRPKKFNLTKVLYFSKLKRRKPFYITSGVKRLPLIINGNHQFEPRNGKTNSENRSLEISNSSLRKIIPTVQTCRVKKSLTEIINSIARGKLSNMSGGVPNTDKLKKYHRTEQESQSSSSSNAYDTEPSQQPVQFGEDQHQYIINWPSISTRPVMERSSPALVRPVPIHKLHARAGQSGHGSMIYPYRPYKPPSVEHFPTHDLPTLIAANSLMSLHSAHLTAPNAVSLHETPTYSRPLIGPLLQRNAPESSTFFAEIPRPQGNFSYLQTLDHQPHHSARVITSAPEIPHLQGQSSYKTHSHFAHQSPEFTSTNAETPRPQSVRVYKKGISSCGHKYSALPDNRQGCKTYELQTVNVTPSNFAMPTPSSVAQVIPNIGHSSSYLQAPQQYQHSFEAFSARSKETVYRLKAEPPRLTFRQIRPANPQMIKTQFLRLVRPTPYALSGSDVRAKIKPRKQNKPRKVEPEDQSNISGCKQERGKALPSQQQTSVKVTSGNVKSSVKKSKFDIEQSLPNFRVERNTPPIYASALQSTPSTSFQLGTPSPQHHIENLLQERPIGGIIENQYHKYEGFFDQLPTVSQIGETILPPLLLQLIQRPTLYNSAQDFVDQIKKANDDNILLNAEENQPMDLTKH